ncbi:MAG: PKD domain-containing protein, partial [Acidobacteria bacterium]|nr:PKD domain-containing protein [Acidobacteriota bacterium]
TGSTATTFAASGIGNGTYYLRVRATNSFGTSGPSNEATLVVGGGGCSIAPGAPGSLTITQNSGGNVAFRWTAAAGGPTTYVLEAGSAPGLANLATVDLGGTGTAFATSGVGAGTYYVRVKAANACGTSAPSNDVVLIVP